MSSRKTHTKIGMAVGASAVSVANYSSQSTHYLSDYAGGIIGGYFGARIADIIDPPTSPNHRSIAHGIAPNALIAKLVWDSINDFRKYCFQKSDEYAQRAKECMDNPWIELFYTLLSEACKFVAGLSLGVIAGHLSHLALDVTTPKSLPLIA